MGIFVTAYRKLTPFIGDVEVEDDYPVDYARYWKPGLSLQLTQTSRPGLGDGIDAQTVYTFTERFSFEAGSYNGFAHWCDLLAQLAKERQTEGFNDIIQSMQFDHVECVIGPIVAKTLALKFSVHKDTAAVFSKRLTDSYDAGNFIARYLDWLHACEMAADGGAVDFG